MALRHETKLVHDVCNTPVKRIRISKGRTRFLCGTCHRTIQAIELTKMPVDDLEIKEPPLINMMSEPKQFCIILTPGQAYDIAIMDKVEAPKALHDLITLCFKEVHG